MKNMRCLTFMAVLSMIIALLPMSALVQAAENDIVVSMDGPGEVGVGGQFQLNINISDISDFSTAEYCVVYDTDVFKVVAVNNGELNGRQTDAMFNTKLGEGTCVVQGPFSYYDTDKQGYVGYNGSGTIATLIVEVIGGEPCQDYEFQFCADCSPSPKVFAWDSAIEHTLMWEGTSIKVVNSRTIASVTANGDTSDLFEPGDSVYVTGGGFDPGSEYALWVQPYMENIHIAPGDDILPEQCPFGDTPVQVTVANDGTFEGQPILLWDVPQDADLEYWEIVADRVGANTLSNVYNPDEDALDACSLTDEGFRVYPELPTYILFAIGIFGLIGVGGYLARRKTSCHMSTGR
ncbi:MAG: cohesin domain-containing protein [Chloroflexota bacterium]|nr:cohesin domain-containing protein [Chloroflexota bacterium]